MLKKRNDENTIIRSILILTLCMVLVVTGVTVWFRQANRERVDEYNINYLEEGVRQKVELIEAELELRDAEIENYAYLYGNAENTADAHEALIKSWENSEYFDLVVYSGADGTTSASDGNNSISLLNTKYFSDGLNGYSGVLKTTMPGTKDETCIAFYTPVRNNSKAVTGVMTGFMGKDKINKILETYFFDIRANVMLMQGDGDVISYTTDVTVDSSLNDMYEIVYSIGSLSEETAAKVHKSLSQGEGITVEYIGTSGETSHACLEPIDGTQWFIVESFPTVMENKMVKAANDITDQLVIILSCIILCYLAFVFIEYKAYKKKTQALEKEKVISRTDPMTGLGNRTAYEEDMMANSKTTLNPDFVIVSFDLNELKSINDNYGHAAGDEVIKSAGSFIEEYFSKYGSIYRIGGDEFVATLKIAKSRIEKVISDFNEDVFKYEGENDIKFTVSTGYACLSDNPQKDVYELAKIADIQMYKCKSVYYSMEGHDRRRYRQQEANPNVHIDMQGNPIYRNHRQTRK